MIFLVQVNCWEYKNCGRQTQGDKTGKLGICPASQETKLNLANGGINAGRACWVVAGTFCGGKPQGTYVSKINNCTNCDFYQHVRETEGSNYLKTQDLLKRLRS